MQAHTSRSSRRSRSIVSSAGHFESLEVRRLLSAAAGWAIDSPEVPRDAQGHIAGNFVHELDRASGQERISPVSDLAGDDMGILNQSLRRAGFSGVAELVGQLGDPKTFTDRLTDALDDGSTPNSVFGNDDRYQIFAGTTFPWRSVVRVGSNDGNYRGSGAMISPYHVLTAGHVVHSGAGGNWITTLQCSPGQTDQNTRPYGQAEWTFVRSYTNWTNSSDVNWDWAVITLDRRIGNFTGWMGQEWNGSDSAYNGTTVNIAGYPSDKAVGTMWGSNGPISSGNANRFFYNGTLDTMPGHSGSPVWRFDGTNRYIVGAHTYGDNGDGFNKATRMTQQKFNDLGAWIGDDNNVRPPTDRSDLLDYDDWFNTNTSSVSPGSVQQGSGINAFFNLRNNGTANANNAVIRFYASTNTTISSGDVYLGEGVWNLSAIGTFGVNFNGTIPASTATGSYYIGWIIDATNTNAEYNESNNTGYHNTPITVTAAPVADFLEPNDSWANARSLGTLVDTTYNGLNIHTSGNDDYFRFAAGNTGTLNLSLSFTHSLGDIDVALLNSGGAVLASSTGTSNSEFISYALTRGTVYGVRVYGYQGATNPSYSMVLDAPEIPLDGFEANDDFGSANDLGVFTYRFYPDLTVHASNNADFYRFTSPGDGEANFDLGFTHADGDIDVVIYSDTGTYITSSTGITNAEHCAWSAVQGQTYVAHVYGYAGSRTWKYDMGIILPPDTTAPAVNTDQFAFETAAHELRFTFSEDVSASISADDLILDDLTNGGTVPAAYINVSYDFGTNTATFTFPGFANGTLPQANYLATIAANSVLDSWGNPMAGDHTKAFRYLVGDADGNGVVDFDDYVLIDQGFNNGWSGFSNGDFDYNGVIDFDDYVLIDLAFNTQ